MCLLYSSEINPSFSISQLKYIYGITSEDRGYTQRSQISSDKFLKRILEPSIAEVNSIIHTDDRMVLRVSATGNYGYETYNTSSTNPYLKFLIEKN